jgi:hypothetical protein
MINRYQSVYFDFLSSIFLGYFPNPHPNPSPNFGEGLMALGVFGRFYRPKTPSNLIHHTCEEGKSRDGNR